VCFVTLALAACASPSTAPVDAPLPAAASVEDTSIVVEERAALPLPVLPEAPRGLGTMSARVPGTSETVGGVRLSSHHARVTIEHGIARTEVEEEFHNETGRVLEGRLSLPLPADASLARLALWVGRTLVEGEIVEKSRADRIFRGIVDDTVRPRDPALLDRVSGGEVSLRIFPIPAHGARKVLFAYDQLLRRESGSLRYVHPLSLGGDRATPIGTLSVTVNGVTKLSARDVVPTEDVVVPLAEAPPAIVSGAVDDGKSGITRAVAVRTIARAPEGSRPFRGSVAIALDVSAAQSPASLAAQAHLADEMLRRLARDEAFVLLACDTACEAFPPRGLASATGPVLDDARRFVTALAPRGASDPAGALREAASRLSAAKDSQIVLLSDGTATAGELSTGAQLAHVTPLLAGIDVRVVGVGRAVDDVALAALARGLGGTYDPLVTGAPIAQRVSVLADARRAPIVREPAVALPAGAVDASPTMPTRDGDEVVVLARLTGDADTGARAGMAIPRLWARARVAELETRGAEADREITALATRHHLLSRTTSLLVLENDRMFAEFGVPRTTPGEPTPLTAGAAGHSVKPPSVRMGMTMVSGRLPPEAVQRVIRQRFGRFRGCYQRGLLRDAGLTGRVVVRFVIDRDGAVPAAVDGGSDLPDPEVIACVLSEFGGLTFTQPEGGIVTVIYPLVFSPTAPGAPRPEGEQRAAMPLFRPSRWHDIGFRLPENSALAPKPYEPPPPVPPTVVHLAGDDRWRDGRAKSLDRLLARTERNPEQRSGHLDAIRALVSAGKTEEAYGSSLRFVALDPASPVAHEALAETAAATFRSEEAVAEMATAAALDPRSKARHRAAMRAARAAGDLRRACAHARALGELSPGEHAALAEECRVSGALALPAAPPGGFEATMTCEGACPDVAVITPGGRVLSRWTAGSTGEVRVAAPLAAGTYRTLVSRAGRGGTITVRALGTTFTRRADEVSTDTAIVSHVTIPPPVYMPRVRI
jgi:hypothetical protein